MDLIGQKFNKLLIIGESKTDKKKVICQCDCGTIKEINKYNLKSGQVQSCGCLHKEKISKDLKDKRFGKLIVLEKTIKRTKDRNIIWKCKCDCGNITYADGVYLRQGDILSC